jgi:hypothetical protein
MGEDRTMGKKPRSRLAASAFMASRTRTRWPAEAEKCPS